MTTELLKQALSAMRDVADLMADRWPMDTQQRAPKFFQAMRDIDTALAQPADEEQQAGFVSVPVEPATDTKRLNFMQDNLLREASMRFDDGSFKAVNAWTIASAGKDLRAAVDAMIAAAKGDGK